MGTLNLNAVTGMVEKVQLEVVEVPEFGEGVTVNIRPLSAYEFRKLGRLSVDWSQVDRKLMKAGGYQAEDMPRNPDFEEAAVVTAWCAQDDKGRLVFGNSPGDAETRVKQLPAQYRAAIDRIHLAVLRLSGLGAKSDPSAGVSTGSTRRSGEDEGVEETAVLEAEKN